MPGDAHSYLQQTAYLINFTLTHGPGSWTLQEKEGKSQKWTGARAATAGPCCSCQRDSLAACKHVGFVDKLLALTDPGAHGNEQGQANKSELDGGKAKLERGQELVKGSGHGRQRWQGRQNTTC